MCKGWIRLLAGSCINSDWVLWTYFIFRGPLPPDVQLIAHRGGPAYKPENTIAAFNHAIDVGVNWIEFDVQRTQDNVLVVFHDETVDRTTDGVGSMKELTFDQIRELNAGDGENCAGIR